MLKKAFTLLSLFAVVLSLSAAGNAAKLDYKNLVVPTLKPAGTGALAGSNIHYMMRGQQVVFFCVKDGETIKFVVKHFGGKTAGKDRPDISYVIIDQQKNVLKEGIIANGKLDTVAYKVEKAGTYALVISSGRGAVAWYTVATKNPFAAVSAVSNQVYFFTAQRVFVPGKAKGCAELKVRSSGKECYAYAVDGGEKVESNNQIMTVIPLGDGAVTKVHFTPIPKKWCQNFSLIFPEGQTPLVFFGPERAVEIVK